MFSSMLLNVLQWLTHLREGQMMSVVNLKLSSLGDDRSSAVLLNDLTAKNKTIKFSQLKELTKKTC